MAIGDPITMALRLARITTGAQLRKGEVVGVATRLIFEADTVAEEHLEQLIRLQHDQEVTVTVEQRQLGLDLPATKPTPRRRAAAGR